MKIRVFICKICCAIKIQVCKIHLVTTRNLLTKIQTSSNSKLLLKKRTHISKYFVIVLCIPALDTHSSPRVLLLWTCARMGWKISFLKVTPSIT